MIDRLNHVTKDMVNEAKINGVKIIPLKTHKDARGSVTVLFNEDWAGSLNVAQFNYVNSVENSLRGMHVHEEHSDYLCVLKGTMLLGIKDLRKNSETFGQATKHKLTMEEPRVFIIPPGVAHGFYFPEDTLYCYGLSHPWNPKEKLGFHWNSPNIGIEWPTRDPLVSDRDANAGGLDELLATLHEMNI